MFFFPKEHSINGLWTPRVLVFEEIKVLVGCQSYGWLPPIDDPKLGFGRGNLYHRDAMAQLAFLLRVVGVCGEKVGGWMWLVWGTMMLGCFSERVVGYVWLDVLGWLWGEFKISSSTNIAMESSPMFQ